MSWKYTEQSTREARRSFSLSHGIYIQQGNWYTVEVVYLFDSYHKAYVYVNGIPRRITWRSITRDFE